MTGRRYFCFSIFMVASTVGQAAVFEVDSAGSSAYFAVDYFGNGVVKGGLSNIKGSVELDDVSKKGVADMTFDMRTVETGSDMLNSFIKSSYIFDTATYPSMRFRSTQFEYLGEQLVAASGMLTLHGVTKPIRLQVNKFFCSDSVPSEQVRARCNGNFHATISRSRFGMNKLSLMVNDEVAISVQLSLQRLDVQPGTAP